MTEVVLFHHAQGLTPGVQAFADRLRAGGHLVHTPDLYDGQTFADLDAGLAYRDEITIDVISQRALAAVVDLPRDLVYAGFSLGAMPAEQLAATSDGARGALLFHSAIPVQWLSTPWPAGLPMQIHISEGDPFEEREDMESLVVDVGAELFLYPGNAHLFTDSSLEVYDPTSTDLVVERSLAFLEGATGPTIGRG